MRDELKLKMRENFAQIEVTNMRNVYQSLDHNAQLFNKKFLNQLVPFLVEMAKLPEGRKVSERVSLGVDMLSSKSG